MRSVTTNIYNFGELNETAKGKARQWFREASCEDWSDEKKSIEAIGDVLHADRVDYSVGTTGYSYVEYVVILNDEILSMEGNRALTWVFNNWIEPTFRGKYYGKLIPCEKSKEHPAGFRHIYRNSNCTKVFNGITGFYMDMNLYEAYAEMQKSVKKGNAIVTVMGFLKLLEERLTSEWKNEMDYHDSDEYIDEMMEANGYEFYEDGKRA